MEPRWAAWVSGSGDLLVWAASQQEKPVRGIPWDAGSQTGFSSGIKGRIQPQPTSSSLIPNRGWGAENPRGAWATEGGSGAGLPDLLPFPN